MAFFSAAKIFDRQQALNEKLRQHRKRGLFGLAPKGQISFLMLKQEESLHTKRMAVLEDITEPFSSFSAGRYVGYGFDPELALSKY